MIFFLTSQAGVDVIDVFPVGKASNDTVSYHYDVSSDMAPLRDLILFRTCNYGCNGNDIVCQRKIDY